MNVSEIIKRAISGYKPAAADRKAEIQFEIQDDIYFLSDGDHLYNVVDNLLKNAIEAVPKSGGHIHLMLQHLGKELIITVKDNGCGMNEEQIKQVRKPFFTTKDTKENYGLGMTYCYRAIKKMNGRIAIESKQGTGTSVKVFLKQG